MKLNMIGELLILILVMVTGWASIFANLKIYTEIMKEKSQRKRKEQADEN